MKKDLQLAFHWFTHPNNTPRSYLTAEGMQIVEEIKAALSTHDFPLARQITGKLYSDTTRDRREVGEILIHGGIFGFLLGGYENYHFAKDQFRYAVNIYFGQELHYWAISLWFLGITYWHIPEYKREAYLQWSYCLRILAVLAYSQNSEAPSWYQAIYYKIQNSMFLTRMSEIYSPLTFPEPRLNFKDVELSQKVISNLSTKERQSFNDFVELDICIDNIQSGAFSSEIINEVSEKTALISMLYTQLMLINENYPNEAVRYDRRLAEFLGIRYDFNRVSKDYDSFLALVLKPDSFQKILGFNETILTTAHAFPFRMLKVHYGSPIDLNIIGGVALTLIGNFINYIKDRVKLKLEEEKTKVEIDHKKKDLKLSEQKAPIDIKKYEIEVDGDEEEIRHKKEMNKYEEQEKALQLKLAALRINSFEDYLKEVKERESLKTIDQKITLAKKIIVVKSSLSIEQSLELDQSINGKSSLLITEDITARTFNVTNTLPQKSKENEEIKQTDYVSDATETKVPYVEPTSKPSKRDKVQSLQTTINKKIALVSYIPAGGMEAISRDEVGFVNPGPINIDSIPYYVKNLRGNEPITLLDIPYFGARVRGDSMNAVGIDEGDYVVIKVQREPDNGDIVLATGPTEIDEIGKATLKVFYKDNNVIELRPQSNNPKNTIIKVTKEDNLRILGIAIAVLKPLPPVENDSEPSG